MKKAGKLQRETENKALGRACKGQPIDMTCFRCGGFLELVGDFYTRVTGGLRVFRCPKCGCEISERY